MTSSYGRYSVPSFINVTLCLLKYTGIQRQRYEDTNKTIIYFTVVKNIDEQWNVQYR